MCFLYRKKVPVNFKKLKIFFYCMCRIIFSIRFSKKNVCQEMKEMYVKKIGWQFFFGKLLLTNGKNFPSFVMNLVKEEKKRERWNFFHPSRWKAHDITMQKVFSTFGLFIWKLAKEEGKMYPSFGWFIGSEANKYSYIWPYRISSNAFWKADKPGDIPRDTVSHCIQTFYFSNVRTRSIYTDDDKHVCGINQHRHYISLLWAKGAYSAIAHNEREKVNYSRNIDNECLLIP